MASTQILSEVRPREREGWRSGRPVEDPAKTKRFGFVTAKPSEFLVHVRGGRVLSGSSGQGATCFKWPWDAAAVVPTSFQRLMFSANRITAERVGVEVVGLAVYRIAEPLIAYRVLNFSYPERAQEKLEQALTGMFVGATRRLIANLSVDDCLQKRKTALAEELLREIAPVVGGQGHPDDHTQRGWGVVIDTIEIQQVRILSEKVFAEMQAPYRAALEQRAAVARAEKDREIATRETANQQAIEEAKIHAELAVQRERAALAQRKAELQSEAVVHREKLEQVRAQAELDAYELRAAALKKRAELAEAEQALALSARRAESEATMLEGRNNAQLAQLMAEARRLEVEAEARLMIAEKLPALAAAVGQKFGEVKITQIGGGDAQPFGAVAQAVAAVLELARS